MSFSREFRYRNLGAPQERREIKPGYFILAGAGLMLMCCVCLGLLIGVQWAGGLSLFKPVTSAFTRATPTPNRNAPVPYQSKGLGENGLEVTVTSLQRPLTVEGLVKIPEGEEFVLVSLLLRNPKSSGAPLRVGSTEFKMIGDGGLPYDPNPKTVTIENLMPAQDSVAAGKSLERELIFQIANDDSGLKLYWKTGAATRVFLLEAQK